MAFDPCIHPNIALPGRHDVAMQMEGQPARDLGRHFIQRWNHLLRIKVRFFPFLNRSTTSCLALLLVKKNHTLAMPFLIPAPDFSVAELQKQEFTGTCEIQICRSCGPCESFLETGLSVPLWL